MVTTVPRVRLVVAPAGSADDTVTLLATRCGACRRGVQACRDGSETRCTHCGGSGWLARCPHCRGEGVVEVYSHVAGGWCTVVCDCTEVEPDEPIALAAD